MKSAYSFTYGHGQSTPSKTIEANSDKEFTEEKLPAWEKETGFKHIKGSIKRTPIPTTTPVLEPAR